MSKKMTPQKPQISQSLLPQEIKLAPKDAPVYRSRENIQNLTDIFQKPDQTWQKPPQSGATDPEYNSVIADSFVKQITGIIPSSISLIVKFTSINKDNGSSSNDKNE